MASIGMHFEHKIRSVDMTKCNNIRVGGDYGVK